MFIANFERMRRAQIVLTILVLLVNGLCRPPEAAAQSAVPISFTTTNAAPLNPGFAGFCTEMLTDSVEYFDPNFQQVTATLSPGWLRYPGGSADDAFDWTNGLTISNWTLGFPAFEQNISGLSLDGK
jgi:hypothetical protein